MKLKDKNVVILGGTGSLGNALVSRLLASESDGPAQITVFSRGEVKQQQMRLQFLHKPVATDEVIYGNAQRLLRFVIGDVRHYQAVTEVVRNADLVIYAAALKQVPTCEYFPLEAVATNIQGAENLIRAVASNHHPIDTVLGVSSDKAVEPINVYGMTKAIQERAISAAAINCPQTRFINVRYGNVVGSRGSVVLLFRSQISRGSPVTLTSPAMTRFLMTLDGAVDLVFRAVQEARQGETYVPWVPSARIVDLATVMMGSRLLPIEWLGNRPGEKLHEVLVSAEERHRTTQRGSNYVIQAILPEARSCLEEPTVDKVSPLGFADSYCSADCLLSQEQLATQWGSHLEVTREGQDTCVS